MHLKTFTIRGFKSFASATTLNFEPGITCIVGPNGSGKSNILDALVWVMGEQGAKTLRGAKMEDVIFAGTASRPPQSSAEVSLTIDNTDGALPIDFTEVTISRTIFRSGGSEYAINGAPCRLMDIQDLLADSGIGREMTVVGQGRLDSVLRATAEERRGFIEEAAGVLKFRKRKEKALRRLDAMQGNLSRLSDLTTELSRQLGPLRRQADAARKARAFQSEIDDARRRILADDITTLTARLHTEQQRADELRETVNSTQSALTDARERLARLEVEKQAAAQAAAQAGERFHALSTERERLRGVRSVAAERVKLLSAAEASQGGQDLDALGERLERAREDERELSRDLERAQAAVREASGVRRAAECAVAEVERELAGLQREVVERRERLARLETQVAARSARVESTKAELSHLRAVLDAATGAVAAAEQVVQGAVEAVSAAERVRAEAAAERDAARAAVDGARSLFDEATRVAADADKARAVCETRVQMLTASLLRKDGAGAVLAAGIPGVLGPLAEHVRIEPGFESAVAAALGSLADAIAVEDAGTAVAALRVLRGEGGGQASFVISDHGGVDSEMTAISRNIVSAVPGAKHALSVVSVDGAIGVAVRSLLSNVVIVNDLEDATASAVVGSGATVVTREGDLLSTTCARGGSDAGPSTLHLQAQLDEARVELAATKVRCAIAAGAVEQARAALAGAKADADAASARLRVADVALSGAVKEHDQAVASHRSAQADVTRSSLAQEQATVRLAEARSSLVSAQSALAAAQDDPATSEAVIAEVQARRDSCQESANVTRATETEARLALRTVEERHRSAVARTASVTHAIEAEHRARQAAQARAAERALQVSQARSEQQEAERLLAELADELVSAEARRAAAESDLGAKSGAADAARDDVEGLDVKVRTLTEQAHKDEVARAQLELRLEQATGRATDELRIDPGDLVARFGPNVPVVMMDPDAVAARPASRSRNGAGLHPTPHAGRSTLTHVLVQAHHKDVEETIPDGYVEVLYDRAEQEARLKAAEKSLSKIGRINPLALEEFTKLEARHASLSAQLVDLRKTRQDLLGLVEQIDQRIQQVFSEVFSDVAAQFERVFSRLFPGGEGRLVLTDPTDLLNTGIEVEARPAGKMVKRLSLLSGGERSLTAVAFLVSIFKARPSPFLIMDEVEAALDHTNLERLLTIFRELQENSQLIVITHQKPTMEVANALYGVTMRGDGVSTVISRRLT